MFIIERETSIQLLGNQAVAANLMPSLSSMVIVVFFLTQYGKSVRIDCESFGFILSESIVAHLF